MLLSFSFGCASIRYNHNEKLRTASLSSGICALHHIPLERITCYKLNENMCALPGDDYIEIYERFPNLIPTNDSKTQDSYHLDAETVLYCPACESDLEIYIRKHIHRQ
jgi:hypothetical protein